MNGATCTAEGIVLDGNNDYVDIDDWEWGGATSFEVYVKYDTFTSFSRVFDFGSGARNDNVYLANERTESTIAWGIRQGSTETSWLTTSNFDSATWTHVVVSIKDTTTWVYKNGILVGTGCVNSKCIMEVKWIQIDQPRIISLIILFAVRGDIVVIVVIVVINFSLGFTLSFLRALTRTCLSSRRRLLALG